MRNSSRFRQKPVGWRNDSYRHYLAAKGISTKNKYFIKPDPKKALLEVDGEKYYTGTDIDIYVLKTGGATPEIFIKRKDGSLDVSPGTGYMDDEGRLFIVLGKTAGGLKGLMVGEDGEEERIIVEGSFDGWRTIGPSQMAEQVKKISRGNFDVASGMVPPTVDDERSIMLQDVPNYSFNEIEVRKNKSGDLDMRLRENKAAIEEREAERKRKLEAKNEKSERMRQLVAIPEENRTIEQQDELAALLRGMIQAEAGAAIVDLNEFPVDTTPRENVNSAQRARFLSSDELEKLRKAKLEVVDVRKENENLRNEIADVSTEIKGGFDAVAQRVRVNKASIAELDSRERQNEEALGQIFKYSQAWQKAWREGAKRVEGRLNVAEEKINELL